MLPYAIMGIVPIRQGAVQQNNRVRVREIILSAYGKVPDSRDRVEHLIELMHMVSFCKVIFTCNKIAVATWADGQLSSFTRWRSHDVF